MVVLSKLNPTVRAARMFSHTGEDSWDVLESRDGSVRLVERTSEGLGAMVLDLSWDEAVNRLITRGSEVGRTIILR